MDLLRRKQAPILPDAWELIDAEAARVLRLNLAGRKVVDFRGPFGWHFAAVNTGRLDLIAERPQPDLHIGLRRVQPLIEMRVPIKLSIAELDSVARGAENPDLSAVVTAAELMAAAEDSAIFNGYAPGGIAGLLSSSPHTAALVTDDVTQLPRAILAAQETLRQAGISGPYALVLGSELYDRVFAATEDGYPLAKRIEQFLVDKIVRAAAIKGGVLLSMRGGDFELTIGQDLSIGYTGHSRDEVELYLVESLTFRVLEPAAAVRLVTPT